VDHVAEGVSLRVQGRINIDSSPFLRERLHAVFQVPSQEPVVVDLTEVSYMDASGIATLVEGLKVARNRQRRLYLQGLQGRLLHLFEVTGLMPMFETVSSGTAPSAPKVI